MTTKTESLSLDPDLAELAADVVGLIDGYGLTDAERAELLRLLGNPELGR